MRRTILRVDGARAFTVVDFAVILAVMLGFVATTLPTAKAAPGSNTTVNVPANQAWTNTGIDVQNGDQVRISASGVIKVATSDPGKTPDGDQNCVADNSFVAPGLHCYALIGGSPAIHHRRSAEIELS